MSQKDKGENVKRGLKGENVKRGLMDIRQLSADGETGGVKMPSTGPKLERPIKISGACC